MIQPTGRWREFEARYRREARRDLGYREALAIFEALWAHAREINPRLGDEWREDLQADIDTARALHGLPPAA